MGIVIFGSPGSGKGTQSSLLERYCGFYHISTGELLREATNSSSETGRQIKGLIDKGNFVPSSLIAKVVADKIKSTGNNFILDGFPRTIDQAYYVINNPEMFDIQLAVYLRVEEAVVKQRLENRRVCSKCGSNSVSFCPTHPKARLIKRRDDSTSSIKKRLILYTEKTLPVLKLIKGRYPLLTVDATLDPLEIFTNTKSILERIDTL